MKWFKSKKSSKLKKDSSILYQDLLGGQFTPAQLHSSFFRGATRNLVTDVEARELWRFNDIAARVIEVIPDNMFRQGFDILVESSNSTKSLVEEMETFLEELGVNESFKKAKQYERAYGGAALFPVIKGFPIDLFQPLDPARVISIEAIQLFEPRELRPVRYYTDITNPKFRQVELWEFTPIDSRTPPSEARIIHESRLIIFPGIRVSSQEPDGILMGWGDSILSRVFAVLTDFDEVWRNVKTIIDNSGQSVFKMQGLADLMAQDLDQEVRNRLVQMDMMRSAFRSIVLDQEDSFEWHNTQATGNTLPSLLDKFATRIAAAADMPVSLLFGQAPAGLNATGESDIRFFYDRIASEQEDIRTSLEHFINLIWLSRDGPSNGVEPDIWSIRFRPLWQTNTTEMATARKQMAETDKIYLEAGILSAEEIALSRFGGDAFSFETEIDLTIERPIQSSVVPESEVSTSLTQPEAQSQIFVEPATRSIALESFEDVIEKRGQFWVVLSNAGEILGRHRSRTSALQQLRAIEAAKARRQNVTTTTFRNGT